jgi:nucleotide-binding universal stress UspA family protein
VDMIIKYAEEIDADLIIMGTHRRTGLEQILPDSVAERVVRKASTSVLIVGPEGLHFRFL